MNKFILLLKGAMIGLGNVVAGLSGATVAVLCKIYDVLINACSEIIKHPFKVIKENIMLFLGILIGLFLGVIVLEKLYVYAPIPVSLLFSGIIITSIPTIKKEVTNWNLKKYIIFLISFAIIIILPLLSSGDVVVLSLELGTIIVLFILGIISAASMIVPGVSGSMILAATGYYEPILTLLTDTLSSVLAFDFKTVWSNMAIIVVFAFGALAGLIVVAKVIKKLLFSYKEETFSAILGLVSASSISIMLVVLKSDNRFDSTNDLIMWIVGIPVLLIGLFLGYKLSKYEGKNDEQN